MGDMRVSIGMYFKKPRPLPYTIVPPLAPVKPGNPRNMAERINRRKEDAKKAPRP